jgi:hypothetical protein
MPSLSRRITELMQVVVYYIQALDRSEARRDGGYKQNWSFSLSEGSEEERRHE